MSIQKKDYFHAAIQITSLFIIQTIGVIAGLIVVPFAILFRTKGKRSKFGEKTAQHLQKYIDKGSSGTWYYQDAPRWLWPWGNSEDGYLGEPSGKHSARWDGKEQSFRAMYAWAALRNPFNNAKRYSDLFACYVDECELEWKAKNITHFDDNNFPVLNDGIPLKEGSVFIKATNRGTGRKFYGYRLVKKVRDGKVFHVRLGFKVKPKHLGEKQDADDKTKGFTFRIALQNIN